MPQTLTLYSTKQNGCSCLLICHHEKVMEVVEGEASVRVDEVVVVVQLRFAGGGEGGLHVGG